MTYQPFIPKDDPNIPDFYTLTVYLHGEKDATVYQVVRHTLVDKVVSKTPTVDSNGQPRMTEHVIGTMGTPFLEIVTHQDQVIGIPLSSMKKWEFGLDFNRFMEAAEAAKKSKSQTNTTNNIVKSDKFKGKSNNDSHH